MHTEPHPLAGQTVHIKSYEHSGAPIHEEVSGQEYRIEDWQDRVFDGSWQIKAGNPACIKYGMRAGNRNLPLDDECVYGKIGAFGHIVHVSELDVS